jgi:hypothetical protein|tara:strand:- start:1562 stop:1774 length:213 start_codon:yes stop_codon:yes gene_type:complete
MILSFIFVTLFGLGNQEYLDKVEEQVNKGYTWEYQGYTPWSQKKSPSILIEPHGFPPYILFKLTKPREAK